MKTEQSASERTESLLLCISSHLSSRKDCRKVTYRVTISKDGIKFSPDVRVFPNIHRRKDVDKSPVLEHILMHHFLMDVCPLSGIVRNNDECLIKANSLIPGCYEYRSSIDGKRRKWFRINESESL